MVSPGGMAAILAAGSAPSERRLQMAVYLLFALAAALMIHLKPDSGRLGELLVILIALPTFFLWMGWFSRLLLLRAHAASMAVPRMSAAVDSTLLAMVVLTVLLPAIVVASVSSVGLAWSLACIAALAASGLLLALLQRGVLGLLGFLPILVGMTGGDSFAALVQWHDAMPALAALLVLLAAWRWLRVSKNVARCSHPDWRQPLVFSMGQRDSLFGDGDLLDSKAQQGMVPAWLRHGADTRALQPGQVRTLRLLLGGVFAPAGWKQRAVTVALYVLVLSVLMRFFDDGHSPWHALLFLGLLLGVLVMVCALPPRLQRLQQEHGGELAELSLLPGWGDAAQARALLVGAVVRVYGTSAAWVLLLMLGAGALTGQPLIIALALVSTLALAALGVVGWLRPLAGRPWRLDLPLGVGLLLLGVPGFGCTVVAFYGGGLLAPMIVAWSIVLLLATLYAASLWHQFQARAQPFLMH